MSVVGGAMIVAGAALTGEGHLRGIAGVAIGLGCLASIPWYLAPTGRARPAAGGVDGRPEAGLVFRYSTTRTRVATAGLGFFTIAMAALAVWPGELAPGEPAARALGIVGALLTGTMFLVGLANSVRGGPLALTPGGLSNGRSRFGVFVPWEAIRSVSLTEVGGVPYVGVWAADRASIEATLLARWMLRLSRSSGADVHLSSWGLRTEPEWLLATVRHYLEHPQDRRELGTVAAEARFERIAAGA